jgi:hypothetical protein
MAGKNLSILVRPAREDSMGQGRAYPTPNLFDPLKEMAQYLPKLRHQRKTADDGGEGRVSSL